MATVDLFGYAPSTYVRTARLVCEEKEIAYSLVPLEFRADSHRDVHPFLKMPALRHGDTVLFETLAIAIYLNEQFPGPDARRRSRPRDADRPRQPAAGRYEASAAREDLRI